MLQIGGNFGWSPGTLDLKFFCNLILGSRVINISKRYIKVYYRPAGSDRPAKAKLYTVKKFVSIVNFKPNTAGNS